MKLLLKIHNKERHSTTTAAVNLFQRKRKYYHRRHSKSSSPVPGTSLPASQQSVSPASSTPPHVSSSSGSSPLTSAVTGGVSCSTFDADLTASGASLATLIYGGTGSCTEPNACSSERRPLLRNSPSQSSARSYASSSRSGRNNQNRGLPSTEPSTLRQERYFIYGALIFFAIVGFSTAIYFIVNQVHGPVDIDREILFDNNYQRRTMPNLGNSHMIIERRNWGSQLEAHGSVQLEHPVEYVLITHIGIPTKNCSGIHECSNRMRMLQDAAIGERNLPDIPSNFYLGADGNVYVGRGWDIANSYQNRTLSVCFMGYFESYGPKDIQMSALQHLLTYGVIQRKLANDYKLVARRQTKPTTTSPGDQLYAKLKRLPRWNPCGTQAYAHCGAELGFPSVWDEEHNFNERNGIQNPLLLYRKNIEEE
ncbi:peptidoglycan-recognition protein LA isoform X1 [Anopheles funestus]|uniref:peptidoglycan-recognition protein LA isoform X1 n=1 Tax=Anopheles funestus TaxID=62324 RepID=UPI000BE2162E|nr:peptidoglycan-recognition protein LA isoform X1 [Anopheles funestus]